MPQDAASLTELIEKSRLVNLDEMDEIRQLAAEFPEGQAFLKELVARGVLTHWQAGQIFLGNSSFFLGKYKLVDLLGSGGMGRVFRAEHIMMNRRVAIKIIGRDLMRDEAAQEQFLNEARAIAALNHPNIVHAYSIEKEGDRYYIVMEFVDGMSLEQMVNRQGSLPEDRAAIYMLQTAQALAHAHSHNMIHCDIKPANLLVNEQDQIKVLDMGMVRLYNVDAKTSESGTKNGNDFIGTVDYMAPEVADSIDHASPVSDLYSLGCVFYFLLTGCVPFPGASLPERILKHQTEDPIDPRILNPRLSQGISEICLKMMARKIEDRYQSAEEVVDVLGQWTMEHADTTDAAMNVPFDFASDAIPSGKAGETHTEMDFLENGLGAQEAPQGVPAVPAMPEFTAKSGKKKSQSQSGMFAPDGSLLLDAADTPRKKKSSDSSITVFEGNAPKSDPANQPRIIKKERKNSENVGDLFGDASALTGGSGGKHGGSSIGKSEGQEEGEEVQTSRKKSSSMTVPLAIGGVCLLVLIFLVLHGNLDMGGKRPKVPGKDGKPDKRLTATDTTDSTDLTNSNDSGTQPTEPGTSQEGEGKDAQPGTEGEAGKDGEAAGKDGEAATGTEAGKEGKPDGKEPGKDEGKEAGKPKEGEKPDDDSDIIKDDDTGGFKLNAGFDEKKEPEPPKEPAKPKKEEPKPEVKVDQAEEDRVNKEEEEARKVDEKLIAEDVKKIEEEKKVGNPFEKLSRYVALQPQAKNQELVKIESASLPWKLSLLGGDKAQSAGVGKKAAAAFSLQAVDESKPESASWQVKMADKVVAEFWRDKNVLRFRWSESDSGKPKPVKSLGNCALKIECKGKSHKLLLREPSEIGMPALETAKGRFVQGRGEVARVPFPAADVVFVEIKKVGKYVNGTDGASLSGTTALSDITKDKPLSLTFSYNGRGGQHKLQFSFSVSETGMLSLDKQGQSALREIRDIKKNKNLELYKEQLKGKIEESDKAGSKATKVQTDAANKSDLQLWKIGIAEGMDDKLEIEYRVFMKLDGEDVDLIKTGTPKEGKAKGGRSRKSKKNDD